MAKYFGRNKDRSLYSDIDLFFHSLPDPENDAKEILFEIVDKLDNMNVSLDSLPTNFDVNNHPRYYNVSYIMLNNDNVISLHISFVGTDNYTRYEIKLQFIKRSYRSPSEIIHGFDVDSSCILLTLDNKLYVTERGLYALKYNCNTINFERLSPSYEFRILKFDKRGFDIQIPYINFFKKYAIGNFNVFEKTGSDILLKYLLFPYLRLKGPSDYFTREEWNREISNDQLINSITLKTLNPNEQAINTFHRLFLENPKLWFPRNTNGIIQNYIPPFEFIDDDNTFEVTNFNQNTLLSSTIIQRKIRKTYPFGVTVRNLIDNLNFDGYVIVGNEVRKRLTSDRYNQNFISICKTMDISYSMIVKEFMEIYTNSLDVLIKDYLIYKYTILTQGVASRKQILYLYHSMRHDPGYEEGDNPLLGFDLSTLRINSSKLRILPQLDVETIRDLNDPVLLNLFKEIRDNSEFGYSGKLKIANAMLSILKGDLDPKFESFTVLFKVINVSGTPVTNNRIINRLLYPENIKQFLPRIKFHNGIFEDDKSILNTQIIDFNRILYNGESYVTDKVGEYAITNKIHFTIPYDYAVNRDYYFNHYYCYERDGYSYYDPDLMKNALKQRGYY